jgi:hypothetical protein
MGSTLAHNAAADKGGRAPTPATAGEAARPIPSAGKEPGPPRARRLTRVPAPARTLPAAAHTLTKRLFD